MANLFSRIKTKYKTGNSFIKLLYINLAVFIIYSIIHVPQVISSTGEITSIDYFFKTYLCFPSGTSDFFYRPWTLLTYMFVHKDPFHILWNMIWLYFGSKLFLQYFTNKQLITTYILGGISGAIFFKLIFNTFPEYPAFNPELPLIGGSAGIFAIIIAIATYMPNYSIQLPFIGSIRLKYIAWFAILVFYINIEKENPGGNIAHLGGALFGYFYIKRSQKGKSYFSGFIKWINNLLKPKTKLKTVHKRSKSDKQFNKEKIEKQKAINLVLDKISKSGYESLSKEEKDILFQESKK